MTCGECRESISEYLDGELHGSTRRAWETHANSCSECGRSLKNTRAIRSQLAALPRHNLSDAFGFRVRRLLIEEAEREESPLRRIREWLWPKPETAWAAASGTFAAVASVALLWMIWMRPLSPSVDSGTIPTADASVYMEPQAVRYVLEQLPSRGERIENIAIADSTRRARISVPPIMVRSVSADF
jgi:hypothetical protein